MTGTSSPAANSGYLHLSATSSLSALSLWVTDEPGPPSPHSMSAEESEAENCPTGVSEASRACTMKPLKGGEEEDFFFRT